MTMPVAPVDPEPGTTAEYIHQLIIRDNTTQEQYPWTLISPFALDLSDAQADAIMTAIASALPPNPYGWQITGSLNSTTTTITTDEHDYATVNVPADPS